MYMYEYIYIYIKPDIPGTSRRRRIDCCGSPLPVSHSGFRVQGLGAKI